MTVSDVAVASSAARFRNQVAVVTGSGGMMGGTIAVALAHEGARVVLNDRVPERTDRYEERIRTAGGDAISVTADVSMRDGAEMVIDAATSRWGALDILVNVVGGIKGAISNPIWGISEKEWDVTLRVTLTSAFHCTQLALRPMIERRSGKIVNIASTSWAGSAMHAHYAAAKAGLVSLTRSVASQVGAYGINVNAVAPGGTRTLTVERSPQLRSDEPWRDVVPLGRLNEPEDISHAVLFLCSAEARNISGQLLTVAGGLNPSL